jgi:FtsP/CotA-like multicopper oxidase with cupredoxin domain
VAAVVGGGTAWYVHIANNSQVEAATQTMVATKPPIASVPVKEEVAQLSFAPDVPPPITRNYPVKMIVNMTSEVTEIQLDPVYKYRAWTFNEHVPGPFIRARVGDIMQINLSNRDENGKKQ